MEKVKRKRINWVYILHVIDDPVMINYFLHKLSKLRKGKYISSNRCAYCTLKHFYSTTTITDLLERIEKSLPVPCFASKKDFPL